MKYIDCIVGYATAHLAIKRNVLKQCNAYKAIVCLAAEGAEALRHGMRSQRM